jgi:hypothetical protein
MASVKEQVLLTIMSKCGLSVTELHNTLHREDSSLIDAGIKELIGEGQIIFFREKYFPTIRRIMGYDKNHEGLVEEYELPGLTASEVGSILEPYQDDPLFYYGYELSANTATYFTKRYNIKLSFEQHEYFLEACFDDSTEEEEKNNS